jgi:hypothetical protein
MTEATALGLASFRFSWGDHICAVFDDRAQQMCFMVQFMACGLRSVQRCVWVSPAPSADRFRAGLAAIGGDLPTLEGSNQLVIVSEADFYLEGGIFEPERTMDLLRSLLREGQRDGYATMRMATDVSWLRGQPIDPGQWEEFELALTREVAGLPVVLVCQYDRRQVPGPLLIAAFRTHPLVVLGDTLYENPFAVAAEDGAPAPRDVM